MELLEIIKEISSVLASKFPDINVGSGAYGDIVLSGNAHAAKTIIDLIETKLKILKINETNLSEFSDKDIDNIGKVFGITRREATKSSGKVIITTSSNSLQTISAGTKFLHGDFLYEVKNNYTVFPDINSVTDNTHRYFVPVGTNYAFDIPVEAINSGFHSVFTNDVLTLSSGTIANLVDIKAFEDFNPGSDKEDNNSFFNRILNSLSRVSIFNELGLKNLFNNYELNYKVYDLSVIGPDHPISTRNQHWLFPISSGTKLDIYVKTLNKFKINKRLLICTLQNITGPNESSWTFTFKKDDIPALIYVDKVYHKSNGVFLPSNNFTYSTVINTSGETYIPDILNSKEAKFSRFSNVVFTFVDNVRNTSSMTIGDKDVYVFEYVHHEGLDRLHNLMYSSTFNSPIVDILIKGGNICLVDVSISLSVSASVQEISSLISEYINNLDFSIPLVSTDLVSHILSKFPHASISSLNLTGEIYTSNDSKIVLGPSNLSIPTNVLSLLHQDNTYYLARNISVTIL